MKKFKFIFFLILITLSFTISTSAVEVGDIDTTVIETIVDTTIDEITEVEETTVEESTVLEDATASEKTGDMVELPKDLDDEELNKFWEAFKENISKVSVWLTAFFSTSGVAIIAFVVKWGIGKIFDRIAENAHKTEAQLDDKLLVHKEEIMAATSNISNKVDNAIENMEKMFEIMAVEIMNSNEPASAKTEMMGMLQGLKKYSGDIPEVIKQAQDDIEKIKGEKVALQDAMPALDELIEERKK